MTYKLSFTSYNLVFMKSIGEGQLGIVDKLLEQRNRWPIADIESVAVFSAQTLFRNLFGVALTEEELRMRSIASSKQKAEYGAKTIQEGIHAGDTKLLQIGEAAVMLAVCEVDDAGADTLPLHVTETVTDIARNIVVDDANPNISPVLAERVLAILETTVESPDFP